MVGNAKLTPPLPRSEPISLKLAKLQLQIDDGNTLQDDYISGVLIPAAREVAEDHTSKAYAFQQYREFYNHFPVREWGPVTEELLYGYYGAGGVDHGMHRRYRHPYLELSRSPLRKILRLQYVDQAGATQTLDPSQYFVNNSANPAKLDRVPYVQGGEPWPPTLRQVNSVWVDYVVGFGGNVTVTMSASSAALTGVSGYTFTSDDVGMPISVPGVVDGGAGVLISSIASVDTGGNATLADSATKSVSGATAFLGTQPPAGDMQAMLLLINHWYENRMPVIDKNVAEMPYAIRNLLDRNRVYYQP